MKPCISCGELLVDRDDPPLYDVLNPDYDPEQPSFEIGPYCPGCWLSTYTDSMADPRVEEPGADSN